MKTIIQKVKFKASPMQLYEMYMDSKKHSQAIGAPASLSRKVGGPFSAHGAHIYGKNLFLAPGKFIVQTWKGSDWSPSDPHSIFSLSFEKAGKETLVTMVHAFVPDRKAAGLTQGWRDYYWKPWRRYLAK